MIKKNLAIFLLSVLIITNISGCASNTENPQGATDAQDSQNVDSSSAVDAESESTEIKLEADLPSTGFDGYNFRFLNGSTAAWMTTFVVTAEEENGDVVNDAIYRRNMNTEVKFDVDISETSTTSVASETRKSITAGDDSFDIALMTMSDAFTLTLENVAVEYTDIPYIDTEKPWWVQNSMEDLSIANRVYFGISLFDTTHYDGVRTMFFNKSMVEDFSLDDPYTLVKNGTFTLDRFREMGMAVCADIDGDGQWTDADRYGYTSYNSIGTQTLMTGFDAILSISKDSNDLPYFNVNNQHYIERLEAVSSLINDNEGFNNPNGKSENNGGVAAFQDGRALFYNETLGNAQKLRTMDTDFGIVPAPKYNEEQDEYYNLGGNPYFMIVPITAMDLERTGIIMESLAYESLDTVAVAFYDVMLSNKITRDNSSEDMLDIIFNSLSYYHPLGLSQISSTVATNVWANKRDFASYFTSIEAKVQADIDAAIETFQSNVK